MKVVKKIACAIYAYNNSNCTANSLLFTRDHNLEVEPQSLTIAVATPDIPFVRRQLPSLQEKNIEVFILTPNLPTSELPLPQTEIIQLELPIRCCNAYNIDWLLIKVL